MLEIRFLGVKQVMLEIFRRLASGYEISLNCL